MIREHRRGVVKLRMPGDPLIQHDVDAREIHRLDRPEIVAGTVAEALVVVGILDNMADIFDAVRVAPFTQHAGEIGRELL